MNRDALRLQASSRRNPIEHGGSKALWRCDHCSHEFVHEGVFMRHACPEKRRYEQLRSPLGQAAYSHYSHWMKCQKFSVPSIDTFGTSKHYAAFIRFAEFAIKVKLPNVRRYIEVMCAGDKKDRITPEMWCRDQIYSMYLRSYDMATSPLEQFTSSLQVLEDLAVELKVPLAGVFPAIGVETLEDLIVKRKVTFWLLMASGRFRDYLRSLGEEDRERLQTALNAGAVLERINQEAALFREFAAATKEVGL